MDTKFIEHTVIEIDETMIQRCVICGAVIDDYSNSMWPLEQGPPKGYAAGNIYRSENGFITTVQEYLPKNIEVISCLNYDNGK